MIVLRSQCFVTQLMWGKYLHSTCDVAHTHNRYESGSHMKASGWFWVCEIDWYWHGTYVIGHLYGRAGTKFMKQATDFECVRLMRNPCERGTCMVRQVPIWDPYKTVWDPYETVWDPCETGTHVLDEATDFECVRLMRGDEAWVLSWIWVVGASSQQARLPR